MHSCRNDSTSGGVDAVVPFSRVVEGIPQCTASDIIGLSSELSKNVRRAPPVDLWSGFVVEDVELLGMHPSATRRRRNCICIETWALRSAEVHCGGLRTTLSAVDSFMVRGSGDKSYASGDIALKGVVRSVWIFSREIALMTDFELLFKR